MQDAVDSGSSTPWKDSKTASGLRAAGSSLQQSGQSQLEAVREQAARGAVPSYKRGGKVRKTGVARLHKGERVVPAHKGRKKRRSGRS